MVQIAAMDVDVELNTSRLAKDGCIGCGVTWGAWLMRKSA